MCLEKNPNKGGPLLGNPPSLLFAYHMRQAQQTGISTKTENAISRSSSPHSKVGEHPSGHFSRYSMCSSARVTPGRLRSAWRYAKSGVALVAGRLLGAVDDALQLVVGQRQDENWGPYGAGGAADRLTADVEGAADGGAAVSGGRAWPTPPEPMKTTL